MGDLEKAAKWIVPVAFTLIAGVGSAATWGWLAGQSAIEGLMLGLSLTNLFSKKEDQGGSATYTFGRPHNNLSNLLPVPVVYGNMRLYGNVVYNNATTLSSFDRAIALAQGPLASVSDIRFNNNAVASYPGCSATAYSGTAEQTNDERLVTYRGSLKNVAYIAATAVASDSLAGDPVVSAEVEGKIIYDPYLPGSSGPSRNPAMIARDILINQVGLLSADLDEDSFEDVAGYCDAVVTGEYDRGANVALLGACSGGNYPSRGNDGSTSNIDEGWYCTAPISEELTYLGKLTLDAAYLCSLIKLYLWDGDSREFLNYKIEASANDSDYTTLFDGSGSGVHYHGPQTIEFERAEYRYFKIYGTGSTYLPASAANRFHVQEIEVFEDIPAKRFQADFAIDTDRPARDVLDDLLASFGGFFTKSQGKIKLNVDRDLAATENFSAANIIDGEAGVEINQIPRSEKPNRVRIYYTNAAEGYTRADVTDDDHDDQSATGRIYQKEVSLLYITRGGQARRMARQAGNVARFVQWTASWSAGLNAAAVEPGDVVTLSLTTAGWSNKKFRVTTVEEDPANGSRKIVAREHLSWIYADQGGATPSASDRVAIPDPLSRPPLHVSNLEIVESYDGHKDGTWIPKIVATFDPPTDAWWGYADIELSVATADNYRVVGQSRDGGEFEIKNLVAGQTYYVRAVSVGRTGLRAPATMSPSASLLLAGKDTPPSNVTGFAVGGSSYNGVYDLSWNDATDANNDLSHYEIRRGSTSAASWESATVIFKEIRATKVSYRPTALTNYLQIKAFDRSGNESAAQTRLTMGISQANVGTVTATPGPSGIEFSWAVPSSGAGIAHYEIRDGATWATASALALAKTNRFVLQPTKRTYNILVRYYNNIGTLSSGETACAVNIAAPTLAGAPSLTVFPPSGILVDITTPANDLITHYDVHVSETTPFTPSADTLRCTAGKGVNGKTTVAFPATPGTTYYVQVCPIDFLSRTVGDQYTYPSSQAYLEARLIEGDDIVANTITTNHITTAGLDVGGSDEMPVRFRLIDDEDGVVGYLGTYPKDPEDEEDVDRYGAWLKDFFLLGDPANPWFSLIDGVCRINADVIVGDGEEPLNASAETQQNLCYNGGFDEVFFSPVDIVTTQWLPGWTFSADTGASGGSRPLAMDSYADYVSPSAARCAQLRHRPDYDYKMVSDSIKVGPSSAYTLSLGIRKYPGRTARAVVRLYWYDYSGAASATPYTELDDFEPTDAIVRESWTATSPADARTCKIYIQAATTGEGTTPFYLYVSAIKFEIGSDATPFTPAAADNPNAAVGVVIRPGIGYETYDGTDLNTRIGDIGGLDDGLSGTIAVGTKGIWSKGNFNLLSAAGDLLISAGGIREEAFIAGTLAETVLKTALMDKIQTSGNTTSAMPHDYHYGIVAKGETTMDDHTFPLAVYHGIGGGKGPLVSSAVKWGTGVNFGNYAENLPVYRVCYDSVNEENVLTAIVCWSDASYIYFDAWIVPLNATATDYTEDNMRRPSSTELESLFFLPRIISPRWELDYAPPSAVQFTYIIHREAATVT
ncbi:MAG: hypothetical protein BWY28_03088 [bacterium ADurb.Bin236]|nr:MAG: hypothetical protein BWY28_03088 [bacterium ADurb.Bin236]